MNNLETKMTDEPMTLRDKVISDEARKAGLGWFFYSCAAALFALNGVLLVRIILILWSLGK